MEKPQQILAQTLPFRPHPKSKWDYNGQILLWQWADQPERHSLSPNLFHAMQKSLREKADKVQTIRSTVPLLMTVTAANCYRLGVRPKWMADGWLKLGPGKMGITSGKNKNILHTYYSHLIPLWGDAYLPWTESVPGLVVLRHSVELLCACRLGAVGTSHPIYCESLQGLYTQRCEPAACLFPPCFGCFSLPACVSEHAASPVG